MITLKEIAAEAGVSIMTVSNVIHHNVSKVSPATVQRVQRIIEKYNYVPNMAARSLSAKASHIVALLLPQWDEDGESLLQDPYAGQIVGVLEILLRRRGYYVMLCSFTHVEQVFAVQRNWQIDGSILVLPHRDEITRTLIERTPTPLVVIDRYYDDLDVLALKVDDYKGGYLSTRYLLDRGHRRIGFCSPDLSTSSVIQDRYRGFCDALAEFGLSSNPKWLFTNYNHQPGGEAIGHALCGMSDRPTAMVATEDLIACGIIKAAQSHGLRVPEDLSVVGFDDAMPAKLITPALTTVRQDIPLKAQQAVSLLMEGIENRELRKKLVVLDVDVIERDSVAVLS